jgi:hypothetical protein
LYGVLRITAEHSAEYNSQLIPERYTDANGKLQYRQSFKFAFREKLRPYLAPRSFLPYALIYLRLFGTCIRSLIKNRKYSRKRLTEPQNARKKSELHKIIAKETATLLPARISL